jgi:hypothetical protein
MGMMLLDLFFLYVYTHTEKEAASTWIDSAVSQFVLFCFAIAPGAFLSSYDEAHRRPRRYDH